MERSEGWARMAEEPLGLSRLKVRHSRKELWQYRPDRREEAVLVPIKSDRVVEPAQVWPESPSPGPVPLDWPELESMALRARPARGRPGEALAAVRAAARDEVTVSMEARSAVHVPVPRTTEAAAEAPDARALAEPLPWFSFAASL